MRLTGKDIERYLENRKKPACESISQKERDEAQRWLERSEKPGYRKIDFFLSTDNPEDEKIELIVAALKDDRRESMLDWLQDKFSSSYNINKIPDIWDNSRPDDHSWNPFTPARNHWKLKYHEEVGAHQWQIKNDLTWDESGDPSDVAIQVYENGWVILAKTATDVRGFKI